MHVTMRQPLATRALLAVAQACVKLRLMRLPIIGPWFARLAASAALGAVRRWRKALG